MTTNYKWNVKGVIINSLIAVICGFIAIGLNYLYATLYTILSPSGFGAIISEALDGLWFISGPIAFMVTRLPGSAVFTEVVAELIEGLASGGTVGAWGLLTGLFHGIGFEIGFATFKYRCFNFTVLAYASILSAITSFIGSLFIDSYLKLKFSLMALYFFVRLVSIIIFSLLLVYGIWRLFVKTKIIKETQIK